MAKHTSYRGQSIDIEMMKYQNQHDRALGNSNMNARGDKLGAGGTIIKTREELIAERERNMQVPDFLPEHTGHSAVIKTEDVGTTDFDDSMFELDEPIDTQPQAPVAEVAEKNKPRRVNTKKDVE